MLTVLSMLGGKAIGKYVIIAGAVAAVAFGMWLAVQSYNKAIAKAAEGEIKLSQANTETETANANTDEMVRMYTTQRERTQAAQRIARRRARMANETSAVLARILNVSGNVADFEQLLVEQLERGQGFKFNSTVSPDTAGAPGVSETIIPFACFNKETARAIIHNATVTADYIDDVESAKHNGVKDKPKEDDTQP